MFEFRSTSWVPTSLYACLKEADHKLGADREWQGTPHQYSFLADYEANRRYCCTARRKPRPCSGQDNSRRSSCLG
jgi:hypothetical protein